jgi:geranylgeranyl reductase family protein
MRDVIVIGGGPAGLYAARELARRGIDVAVIEEHSSIGRPVHCTGVLGRTVFDEFDLPQNTVLNELESVRFYSPSGQTFSYTPPRPEALVIDRALFDEALSREVLSAGAVMLSGKRVTSIRVEADCVRVNSVTGEMFTARACILACGANYALHRTLGLGVPTLFLRSAQLEVPAEMPGEVELHFSSQIAPKGFAWVVPVRREGMNCVRVGLMCDSNVEDQFQNFVSSIAGRWGIPPASEIRPVRKILPLAPIERTYTDRLLTVGDAAGLVKATTGGGIYYSIVSGKLAADVLADSLKSNTLHAEALANYERRWKQRLGSELKAQLLFRNHAHLLGESDIEDLFELARTDGILPLVRKTATFNHHRKVILALLRHRQFREIFLRAPAL